MAAPTNSQLLIAIAALARGYALPSVTGNQTGIFPGSGNQLQIPINSNNASGVYNTALGSGLVISADANYIYIGSNTGDAQGG